MTEPLRIAVGRTILLMVPLLAIDLVAIYMCWWGHPEWQQLHGHPVRALPPVVMAHVVGVGIALAIWLRIRKKSSVSASCYILVYAVFIAGTFGLTGLFGVLAIRSGVTSADALSLMAKVTALFLWIGCPPSSFVVAPIMKPLFLSWLNVMVAALLGLAFHGGVGLVFERVALQPRR